MQYIQPFSNHPLCFPEFWELDQAFPGIPAPAMALTHGGVSEEEAFMERPRISRGRHWYIAGAAVATLAVVGVVAKASHSGLAASKMLDEIQNARALKPAHKLRNLNDLFFDSQPEEVPWIRTECTIEDLNGG